MLDGPDMNHNIVLISGFFVVHSGAIAADKSLAEFVDLCPSFVCY